MSSMKKSTLAFAALAAVCASAGTVVPYGAAPQQRGDLYLPDTVSAETPKLLLVHGGGWQSGTPKDFDYVGQSIAKAGYR